MPGLSIEKLGGSHKLRAFDCGVPALNNFLIRYALANQRANSSTTYVACAEKRAIGFYSLAVGSVIYAGAPARVVKGIARHPVPVMLLARLAVDRQHQSQGIGRGLLKDALLRSAQAADIAGIRALLVHAKDEVAKRWYQSFGFEESPTDSSHLFLLIKDVQKNLR